MILEEKQKGRVTGRIAEQLRRLAGKRRLKEYSFVRKLSIRFAGPKL